MTPPRMGSFRWWIHPRGGLAVLLGFATAVALVPVLLPTAPTTLAYGKVIGFSIDESERGSRLMTRVQVDDHTIRIRLRPDRECLVGDRIELRRVNHLWGPRYTVGGEGCGTRDRPARIE